MEDRMDLLDSISFELYSDRSSKLGGRMVVGYIVVRITVVIYPTSRISNERGVVVLDGSVGPTHPRWRLTKLAALRRRERSGCVKDGSLRASW